MSRSEQDIVRAGQLRAEGKTMAQIAAAFGINNTTLSNHRNKDPTLEAALVAGHEEYYRVGEQEDKEKSSKNPETALNNVSAEPLVIAGVLFPTDLTSGVSFTKQQYDEAMQLVKSIDPTKGLSATVRNYLKVEVDRISTDTMSCLITVLKKVRDRKYEKVAAQAMQTEKSIDESAESAAIQGVVISEVISDKDKQDISTLESAVEVLKKERAELNVLLSDIA